MAARPRRRSNRSYALPTGTKKLAKAQMHTGGRPLARTSLNVGQHLLEVSPCVRLVRVGDVVTPKLRCEHSGVVRGLARRRDQPRAVPLGERLVDGHEDLPDLEPYAIRDQSRRSEIDAEFLRLRREEGLDLESLAHGL